MVADEMLSRCRKIRYSNKELHKYTSHMQRFQCYVQNAGIKTEPTMLLSKMVRRELCADWKDILMQGLSAEEYCQRHWIGKEVYKHIAWPKHQKRIKMCADMVVGTNNADVGCACGDMTVRLLELVGGTWTGFDFSQSAVDMAVQRFPDMAFVLLEDYNLNGLEGTFDTVVCSEVIEHVEDDKAFLQFLYGVATKRVVLTTPNKHVTDPGHLRLYTENTLHKLMAGLNHTIHREDTFFYCRIDK